MGASFDRTENVNAGIENETVDGWDIPNENFIAITNERIKPISINSKNSEAKIYTFFNKNNLNTENKTIIDAVDIQLKAPKFVGKEDQQGILKVGAKESAELVKEFGHGIFEKVKILGKRGKDNKRVYAHRISSKEGNVLLSFDTYDPKSHRNR